MAPEISLHPKPYEQLYNLLLLADPSQEMIRTYIGASVVYTAYVRNTLAGLYVLFPLNEEEAEIKNIAVDPAFQGKGLGKLLLEHATHTARKNGLRRLFIGTANSSIAQLGLYQRHGFEITELKKNFFTNHYPEPLHENGIRCRHLVMLAKDL